MQPINPDFRIDQFFTRLTGASQSALLLDYDGTLAPFTAVRDKAIPYSGVPELIDRIAGSAGSRVVIVSGRPAVDVLDLLKPKQPLEIWGLHGAERRLPDGTLARAELEPLTIIGLAAIDKWCEHRDLISRCERKANSRAFHWRALPEAERRNLRNEIRAQWQDRLDEYNMFINEFDGGLELRPTGPTKGDVVRTILEELDGSAVVAYMGDDLTDEDAFEALGDRGPGILVRPESRPTRADLWLTPPSELLAFLSRWLQSVEAD